MTMHRSNDKIATAVDSDSDPDPVAAFEYDAMGRRIEKSVYAWNASTSQWLTTAVRYYYDDQRIALQTSVAGGTETDNRYFVYGNYIDEVLLMTNLSEGYQGDFYYGHDHLYSPAVLFDSSGSIAERSEYDAYGKARFWGGNYLVSIPVSPTGSPFAFTGRELDNFDLDTSGNPRLKIMYYRARYYDPQTGRFLQRDPLGVNPAEFFENGFYPPNQYEEDTNAYNYVANQPIRNIDPYGLAISEATCQAGINAATSSATGKKLLADLDKTRRKSPRAQPYCATPRFFCQCCNAAGYFNPRTKNIRICRNNNNSQDEVKYVVIHELIHAWDDCQKNTDWSDCQEHACSEIRSYKNSGMCDKNGPWRLPGEGKQDCVKRNATSSVSQNSNCTTTAAQDVANVFNECWKDREPF